MVRRARRAEFMGDAFVFPGGGVEAVDRSDVARRAVRWSGAVEELPWRAAALRELVEEAGLAITTPPEATCTGGDAEVYTSVMAAGGRLDADRLSYLSNWVTPTGLPRRFDTRFYAVEVAAAAWARADASEVFEATWIRPAVALEQAAAGRWNVPFPTLRHLELLEGFATPRQVAEYATGLDPVPRVQPRLLMGDNGGYRVVLPGEPGFDEGSD